LTASRGARSGLSAFPGTKNALRRFLGDAVGLGILEQRPPPNQAVVGYHGAAEGVLAAELFGEAADAEDHVFRSESLGLHADQDRLDAL
jgi:hypothetical protein